MLKRLSLSVAAVVCMSLHAQTTEDALKLRNVNAWAVPAAQSVAINAAAYAGARVVAVGAKGGILLSDDEGKSWRQSKVVPSGSTLTSVSFIGQKNGWAAGHNGVILATEDGGETWTRQHWDANTDQPLFGIQFINQEVGIAVGLWSRILKTTDGGKSWSAVTLPTPPAGAKKDLNFFQIFGNKDQLFIVAEAGWVLQSSDAGTHWAYQNVGTKASLWAGAAAGRDVWAAGLLGKTFHSADAGKTWKPVDAGMKASVTAVRLDRSRVALIGLDGNVSISQDAGKTFEHVQRQDRIALTDALALKQSDWLYFSSGGIVSP